MRTLTREYRLQFSIAPPQFRRVTCFFPAREGAVRTIPPEHSSQEGRLWHVDHMRPQKSQQAPQQIHFQEVNARASAVFSVPGVIGHFISPQRRLFPHLNISATQKISLICLSGGSFIESPKSQTLLPWWAFQAAQL